MIMTLGDPETGDRAAGPPGKSQVAICILRNTGTDSPKRDPIASRERPYEPL